MRVALRRSEFAVHLRTLDEEAERDAVVAEELARRNKLAEQRVQQARAQKTAEREAKRLKRWQAERRQAEAAERADEAVAQAAQKRKEQAAAKRALQAEAAENKLRLADIGQRLRHSKVWCSCRNINHSGDVLHRQSCHIWGPRNEILWHGADQGVTREMLEWYHANGGRNGTLMTYGPWPRRSMDLPHARSADHAAWPVGRAPRPRAQAGNALTCLGACGVIAA